MSFNPFRKIRVAVGSPITDKQINAVQDNIEIALKPLLNRDQLDSNIIKNISLVPGIVNKVPHTLGRVLQGWIIIRNHGINTAVVDLQDTNTSQHLLLNLAVSEACVVDLLVF